MKTAGNILFPAINWWLLLLLPLIWYGFYPTYFSKAFFDTTTLVHVHASLLIVWVLIVMAQPILILKKKVNIHRILGKVSYVLMPFILITTWGVVSKTYYAILQSPSGLTDFAKESIYIPIIYLLWLAVFYGLAVSKRKRVLPHATYMFAAILTMLGPSIDRILFQLYQYYGIGFNWFAEFAVFVLIDLLLLALLYYQWRKGYSLRAVSISLVIYLAGQLGYLFFPHTSFWEPLLASIM
jgi:hypothetical protein